MNGMTMREREVTDINEIKEIIDKCLYLHLGLVDGDEPYIVPMNYGYVFDEDKLVLYLHTAKRGYKLDLIKKNPKVFFEMCCDTVQFDGDIACRYGMTYSSVMGKGTAEIVEDIEEKKHSLTVLMKTQTGKDFDFEDKMAAIVTIIKINVSSFTAKKRPMPK